MSRPPVRRARLFLDANVLVSAAWKADSKVARLWSLPDIELITSGYVVAECRRNLPGEEQQGRLDHFLRSVRILDVPGTPVLENPPALPAKDQPVLAAAVLARADYLVTGDRQHFGGWYGGSVLGVRVEPPGRFPGVLEES
jgi:predicted nucleic acid-binding protein